MIVLKSDRRELLSILNDEEKKLVLFILDHFSNPSDRRKLPSILNYEETKLVLFILDHFSNPGDKALGLSEKDLQLMRKMHLNLLTHKN